jgi:hypothetical protein
MPETSAEHDGSSILPTPTHCTSEQISCQITFTKQTSRNKRLHGLQDIEPQSFGLRHRQPSLQAAPYSPTTLNPGFSISRTALNPARRGASIRNLSAVTCKQFSDRACLRCCSESRPHRG